MDPVATGLEADRQLLADVLMQARFVVEQRWLESIAPHLRHHQIDAPELRDSVPDYIVALAVALRHERDLSLENRGGAEWAQIARHHAVTRVRHGFDVDEVVREFLILRREIVAVMSERLTLTVAQVELVTQLIGGALAAAVRSYVESRDFESRRRQAQHIGFLTHELRNPLGAATAALAVIETIDAARTALAQPLQILARNLRRLRELIDQTLLAQRLEAHAVECTPRPMTIGALFEEALDGARATARQKGVELVVTFDPEIVLAVDRKLALSALQNVVDNAAKYTDHGRIDVSVEVMAEEVVIHVRDECDGLSKEELATIFEPFERGHQGKSGTGLGLAIARRAVEAHGRTIHAESVDEIGCHFWFALPRARH
ncbi:MAG TPA: HAMP domain-containing sensor histidine kinase [Polyangia bacterium]